jgi:RimJ/RimL family protein N-acetyltransferase
MQQHTIPESSIEAIAREFFRDSRTYGFTQVDYLRFVNHLLDLSVANGASRAKLHERSVDYHVSPPPALPLVGERVHLRAFDASRDRAEVERWLDDPEGKYFLLSRTTAARVSLDATANGDHTVLGVITLPGGEAVGLLAFLNLDRRQGKAELRKMIGNPAYRGKGLAREATYLWIQYGVSTLGLRKIYLDTLDNNLRNIALNEKLGFKVEGLLRGECLIDGERRDILRMAIIVEPPEGGENDQENSRGASAVNHLDYAVTEAL